MRVETKRFGEVSEQAIRKMKADREEKVDNPKARDFTEYANTDQRRRWSPELGNLQVKKQVKRELKGSIVCRPKGKAAEWHGFFVEELQVDTDALNDLIRKVLQKCSDMGHVVEKWKEAEIISVHDRGTQPQPRQLRATKAAITPPKGDRRGDGGSHTTRVINSMAINLVSKSKQVPNCNPQTHTKRPKSGMHFDHGPKEGLRFGTQREAGGGTEQDAKQKPCGNVRIMLQKMKRETSRDISKTERTVERGV